MATPAIIGPPVSWRPSRVVCLICTPKTQTEIGGATHLARDQKIGSEKIPACASPAAWRSVREAVATASSRICLAVSLGARREFRSLWRLGCRPDGRDKPEGGVGLVSLVNPVGGSANLGRLQKPLAEQGMVNLVNLVNLILDCTYREDGRSRESGAHLRTSARASMRGQPFG